MSTTPPPTAGDVVIVLCTFPPGELAAEVARTVVGEGLAACVNLLPQVRSIFHWDGKLCDDPEQLALIKTTAAGFEPLRARIVALHPYDTPEIVAVPLAAGHGPYLDWVRGAVGAGQAPD
jgi:periplasmic divalent cation tolerance protein